MTNMHNLGFFAWSMGILPAFFKTLRAGPDISWVSAALPEVLQFPLVPLFFWGLGFPIFSLVAVAQRGQAASFYLELGFSVQPSTGASDRPGLKRTYIQTHSLWHYG